MEKGASYRPTILLAKHETGSCFELLSSNHTLYNMYDPQEYRHRLTVILSPFQ